MMGLTARQRETLDWITRYMATHTHAPSLREIAAGLGMATPKQAQAVLQRLEDRGHLTWRRGAARSIVLTGAASPPVPAGLPADLQARLAAYCASAGLAPADVVARAVSDHLQAAHIRTVCAAAGVTAVVSS
ncbi:hypothetical protein PQJ75_13975 [Rhodoplanes sp. TEM]|uniref:LexA repressor DNA-binding domain-containing protein n=1 Tax=Rhodoplanes tepidamans TaxID=200616 RepID=A0ABT5JG45_RHOTP|nr:MULTISPECIES: hypothetical protein [Rhodoplanes]MDC7788000.1 hypothetical protein [Rhodoplanes tepidamans]MDC7984840.1 hypothetical protein [Rhodoplanes sp. TEM]MDQ0358429.1 SOS-response transcriptional repressor LexA [Rhodoplanes tepidamans]